MTWLKAVLGLIAIVQWITREMHDSKTFAAGETKAVADALRRASDEVNAALAAGREAERKARNGDFDPELFRKD